MEKDVKMGVVGEREKKCGGKKMRAERCEDLQNLSEILQKTN